MPLSATLVFPLLLCLEALSGATAKTLRGDAVGDGGGDKEGGGGGERRGCFAGDGDAAGDKLSPVDEAGHAALTEAKCLSSLATVCKAKVVNVRPQLYLLDWRAVSCAR